MYRHSHRASLTEVFGNWRMERRSRADARSENSDDSGGTSRHTYPTSSSAAARGKSGFMPKLIAMLASAERDVAAWNAAGTSFLVYDVQR